MKLENQVCSLELAKKLKELGIKQDSLFYWGKKNTKNLNMCVALKKEFIGKEAYYSTGKNGWETRTCGYMYSAFSVAELGKILPESIKYKDKEYYLSNSKIGFHNYWEMYYAYFDIDKRSEKILVIRNNVCKTDGTEANARAKCLIYLIEQGIIKL